jgi:parallel beta helix pectate lyase-like protein
MLAIRLIKCSKGTWLTHNRSEKSGRTEIMPRNARIFHARICSLLLLVILAANLLAAPVQIAHAFSLTVAKTGIDSGNCLSSACLTIGYAVGQAASGDTINIGPGIYIENLTLSKQLILNGTGATYADTVIDGNLAGTVITISPGQQINIEKLTIRNGSGGNAGGIYNQGALTVMDSAITGNTAVGNTNGGGIRNAAVSSNASTTIIRSLISGNTSGGEGGGIANVSYYLLTATLNISDSTISNNNATTFGGGIANYSGAGGVANATLVNTTISGNQAFGADGGGINIAVLSGSTTSNLNLTNVTITNNSANGGVGGGISTNATIPTANITLYNSIVANNTATTSAQDIQTANTTLTSNGGNLIGDNSGIGAFTPQPSDQVGTATSPIDPLLGPLQNNGGSTPTQALLADSPAVDKGAGCPQATDQRGVPRPQGAACDIGAYEAGASWYVSTTGSDTNTCVSAAAACRTIAAAIGKAGPYETVSVDTGTYNENLTVNKDVTLAGAGPGATILDGSNTGTVVTIPVSNTVNITGIAIQNGNAPGGGGINNLGNLTLSNAVLRNNQANVGSAIGTTGGLSISDSTFINNGPATGTIYGTGTISIDRSTFSRNFATNGGALYLGGAVTISGSTFTGNSANANDGGAIFASGGTMTIENSTVSGNSAAQTGGGLVTSAGVAATVVINNSTFANNSAGAGGNFAQFLGNITVRNTIIANPAAGGNCRTPITDGGNNIQFPDTSCAATAQLADPKLGPLQNNGGPTLTQALLPGSAALDAGNTTTCTLIDQRGVPRPQGSACDIGAYERGAATLHVAPAGNDAADCLTETTACRTIGAGVGKASAGDAISIAAGSYHENLTLAKNLSLLGEGEDTTIIDGGGTGQTVSIASGTAITLTGVTVTNGNANQGAGIFNAGTLALLNSTVSNSRAPVDGGGVYNVGSASIVESTIVSNSAQYGAGLYNYGQLTVVRSTISGNRASVFGSGLQNWGNTTIRNSTIAENSATVTGGGLHSSGGAVTLINSTVVSNTVTSYGAGVSGGGIVLANTIVANNIAAANPDIDGAITSQGNNLVRNPAGASGLGPSDLVNIDPKLGALQDNGGASLSIALGSDSPAIDAGNNATCAPLDQRAITRPQGPACDIGAIETAIFSNLIVTEVEPNDVTEQANLLVFDRAGHTARSGTISATTDLDIYTFSAQPGATVAISLTNLPADYDIALLSDPRVSIPISDSLDLGSIADTSRSNAQGQLEALGQTTAADRINAIAQRDIAQRDIAQRDIAQRDIAQRDIGEILQGSSANQGTASEAIIAFLPRGGQYFIAVYGAAGSFDRTRSYRLDATLQDGGLKAATPKARPLGLLNAQADQSVRTIYLYNSARMRARYPQEAETIGMLASTLQPGSSLMTLPDARGVSIDLGGGGTGAQLLPDDIAALNSQYMAWDSNANSRRNPLQANELAQQIWYVLDRAVTNYYTGTTDIVLVGGDDIIPFYRVPDEVPLANESAYYNNLKRSGVIADDSALAGSLLYHFIQTDNFYADRAPTPWRGRALYLPDLGIGRLVEQPAEIMHYLNSYLTPNQYVIDASNTNGAALVTGYDFLSDQANAISSMLDDYGFKPGGTLGASETLNTLISSTISDTWNVNDLTAIWFSGQLPSLTGTYSGPRTKYQLMSINGHFSHYDATPADTAAGHFFANRLLDPTAINDTAAYFRAGASTSLLYSVGCHSGLNVVAGAINSGAPAFYSADFPQAVLKQGGNWIGNTGYGYGDSDLIGYSERLSVLFTKQIGRDVRNGNTYIGATIGDSLARAKRRYVLSNGPGGFSVYDEKIIEEMTLYGLPFIRVKVPTPNAQIDPAPLAIPSAVLNGLSDKNPVFTRTIRITNKFSADLVPKVSSQVVDSFRNSQVSLASADQMAQGRPVLPTLTYDITLLPTAPGAEIALPRGVRLLSAKSLPDLENYDPHVTTPVTDQVYPQQQENPTMTARDAWLPDLPYAIQRTARRTASAGDILTDQLVISPAQFNASNGESGQLRRFTEMVFEVTYVEPQIAPASVLAQASSPLFSDVRIIPLGPAGATAIQAARQSVRFSVIVSDSNGSGLREVSATYTADGLAWQRQQLLLNPDNGRYEATLPAPAAGGNISAFFESLDNAGNVAVETRKGALAAIKYIFMPVFGKQTAADLTGSLRLSPSKLTFAAGDPVTIDVIVTNNGSARAAPFWVDFYINPSKPPTGANSTWNMVCGMTPCFGITWAVPGGLNPNESITLTSTPGQFAAAYSSWPGYFARGTADLYLYVDSWNPGVDSGAVPESNESNNRAELHGLVVTGPNPKLLSLRSVEQLPVRPALPGR